MKRHDPAFLALVEDARSRIRETDVQGYLDLHGEDPGVVLVDVREDREWEAGHAAGAVHLGKGVIERDIGERFPDRGTPLVLYCGGGFRSALAAEALQKMGYQRVWSLAGGWRAWQEAGGEVE